jgi:hypothetical protein
MAKAFFEASLRGETIFSTEYSHVGGCAEGERLIVSGSRKEMFGVKQSEKLLKACTETKSTVL